MIRKLLIMSAFVMVLTGCCKSIFENEARCPFVDRGGCQSMEMVNKMVDERRFTPDGLYVQQACLTCKPSAPLQNKGVRSKTSKTIEVYK